jgi:hypothetical protein
MTHSKSAQHGCDMSRGTTEIRGGST